MIGGFLTKPENRGIAYPQILHWGGSVFPFCRAKSGFWGPRPLQNEEPAKNVARCFLYKIRAPSPLFFGALLGL